MWKKDTNWFDSFFDAMMSSPEYSKLSSDLKWLEQMEEDLKKIDKETKKFANLQSSLQESFATPEAIKEGLSSTQKQKESEKKKWDPKNDETKDLIEIEYFEKKDEATWWFKWVAWMQDLKDELEKNFIKPLKFKFFAESLISQENESKKSWDDLYKRIYSAYKEFRVEIPTGILFYWPPWTWKTYITKKLAEELGAWFIKKSVWELWSSYVHQTSKNIHLFFKQAKAASQKGPVILFLDEIDSLVSKRWSNVDASKTEEVSQFLQEFNDLEDAPNLVIIAATNRPDHLDSAILRSWRFDKKIYIWEPDFIARKELFEIFIEKKQRPHTTLDYEELAKLSKWYVAADIEAIIEEASRDASQWILDLVEIVESGNHDIAEINKRLEWHTLSMPLLQQAIKDTTSSLKMVDMSIYTKWLDQINS